MKIFFAFLTLFAPCLIASEKLPVPCEEKSNNESSHNFENDSLSFTKLLPVNVALAKGQRLNLIVEIPKGFRCLQDPLAHFTEFIPVTDKNENAWSEIITLNVFPGKRIAASEAINSAKKNIRAHASGVRILDEEYHKDMLYSTATITLVYNHKGRRELMFARYYSGPYDCSGFQYTILLNTNICENDALTKIKEFAQEHTSIRKF